MVDEPRVLCETPTSGKRPTRIAKWKYDLLRTAILKVVPDARQLAAAVGSEEPTISSLKQLYESRWGKPLSRARPFGCFNCDGSKEAPSGPGCSCSHGH